jgi:hypothetical protein
MESGISVQATQSDFVCGDAYTFSAGRWFVRRPAKCSNAETTVQLLAAVAEPSDRQTISDWQAGGAGASSALGKRAQDAGEPPADLKRARAEPKNKHLSMAAELAAHGEKKEKRARRAQAQQLFEFWANGSCKPNRRSLSTALQLRRASVRQAVLLAKLTWKRRLLFWTAWEPPSGLEVASRFLPSCGSNARTSLRCWKQLAHTKCHGLTVPVATKWPPCASVPLRRSRARRAATPRLAGS